MSRPLASRLVVLVALGGSLFLGAGCAQRTEVVIGVATDLKAKGQLNLVTLAGLRDGVQVITHRWDLTDIPAGNYELPGSFGIYSPDDSEPRIDLQVQGFLNGQLVATRESIFSLVSNATLFTRLALVSDCNALDGPVCPATQSCIEGVCRDKAVDAHTFPPYTPPLVNHVACQSGTQFIVSSSGTPMPLLAGSTGCGPNQFCQEGTCYNVLRGQDAAVATGVWIDQMSPLTDVLHAVWQTPDGQDVFAVGDAGTILHLHSGTGSSASSWVKEAAGSPATLATLTAVWGTSVDDVWVAGTLFGSPVSAVPPPPVASSVLLHRTGGVWTLVMPTVAPATIRGVSGTSSGDVWAVGLLSGATTTPSPSASPAADTAAAIFHYDGSGWTQSATLTNSDGSDVGELQAVFATTPTDVTVVGLNGLVAHFDGASFTSQTVSQGSTPVALHGVVGTAPGDVTIVGAGGLIARIQGGAVTYETSGISGDLFAVAALSPTELVAVGDFGVILRGTRTVSNGPTTWRTEKSGTNVPLFAVSAGAPNGEGALVQWVVGRNGTVRSQALLIDILDGGPPDALLPDLLPPPQCTVAAGCPSACSAGSITARSCTGGTCVDASPAPCANHLNCTGDGSACLTMCAVDTDCVGSYFCGSDNACHARIAQGNACDAANHAAQVDCTQPGSCGGCDATLFCTDGVCCTESPTQCGGCSACAAKTGKCTPVVANEDPHGACTGMTAECQQTTCNGTGSCANSGNACGTNACSGSSLTTSNCVKGTCTANAPTACPGGVTCKNGTTCNGGCASDADCVATSYCAANATCQPRKAGGTACNLTDHPTGATCATPGGCGGCDNGGPQLYCTDGVCCTSNAASCSGCKMCAPPGDANQGSCINVPANQDPHNSCTAGTCTSASCNGANSCNIADGTVCATACTPSTSQSTLTTTKCAAGACTSASTVSCPVAESVTCANATSCITACAGDTDCEAGYYCAHDGTCKAQIGAAAGGGGAAATACMNLATNPINGQAGDCKQDHCRECKSGFCVDGYCCNAGCSGSCQACDVNPDQSGQNQHGTCTPLPTSAPQPQTTTVPQPVPPRTECTTPTCTPASNAYSGAQSVSAQCQGGGTCGSPNTFSCAPYTGCNGTNCATSCTKDTDCITAVPPPPITFLPPTYYCNSAGQCATVLALGAACGATPCYGGGASCRVCGADTCIPDAVGGGTCCSSTTCGNYSCQSSGVCNGRCISAGGNTACAKGKTCVAPTCQ